ncbi:MAG: type 4a pilus biogenesis protein PilO [Sedimentisphaerales bacterium]|nr:type 4a pilus biogenesis protein PilO [Sedimentisphaerales bacterium]
MRIDRQQLVIGLLALAVIAGFGMVGYYPLIHKTHRINRVVEERREYMDKTDTLVVQLAGLQARLEQLEAVEWLYNQRISADSQDVSELWGQIADEMKTHGLQDQLIQPREQTVIDGLQCNTINLEGAGSLSQIFAFLQSLDRMERLIRFQKLELQNEEDFSGRLKLVADAKVYCQTGSLTGK